MKRSLFIFRRDLRLEDNTGLLFALKHSEEVICCFIFTPEQIVDNPYRSDHCLQFMLESLEELGDSLRAKGGELYLFYGNPEQIVSECIKSLSIQGVVVNRDYTPYSVARDQKIEQLCRGSSVAFYSFEDLLLQPVEKIKNGEGKPYGVFTPFFKKAQLYEVEKPKRNLFHNYFGGKIFFAKDRSLFEHILPRRVSQQQGGRGAGKKILKTVERFHHYEETRDIPSDDATTHLSPHLKFTTLSIREVYHTIQQHCGHDSPLIRSLYWRDFFISIAHHFPRVFLGPFQKKFKDLPWENDVENFSEWCLGETGFPIVDAGMREMNQTGFMHNRVRMITASFLIKDLHIDWRWGERYFAQTLIDYDPAVNNGNWQWVASTGCDGQPFFRIFNPWLQGQKFDPSCIYIKRWIPELEPLPPRSIHAWHKRENQSLCPAYPPPMVDHQTESKRTLAAYKKAYT